LDGKKRQGKNLYQNCKRVGPERGGAIRQFRINLVKGSLRKLNLNMHGPRRKRIGEKKRRRSCGRRGLASRAKSHRKKMGKPPKS